MQTTTNCYSQLLLLHVATATMLLSGAIRIMPTLLIIGMNSMTVTVLTPMLSAVIFLRVLNDWKASVKWA